VGDVLPILWYPIQPGLTSLMAKGKGCSICAKNVNDISGNTRVGAVETCLEDVEFEGRVRDEGEVSGGRVEIAERVSRGMGVTVRKNVKNSLDDSTTSLSGLKMSIRHLSNTITCTISLDTTKAVCLSEGNNSQTQCRTDECVISFRRGTWMSKIRQCSNMRFARSDALRLPAMEISLATVQEKWTKGCEGRETLQ